jgi:hypothetical protein
MGILHFQLDTAWSAGIGSGQGWIRSQGVSSSECAKCSSNAQFAAGAERVGGVRFHCNLYIVRLLPNLFPRFLLLPFLFGVNNLNMIQDGRRGTIARVCRSERLTDVWRV